MTEPEPPPIPPIHLPRSQRIREPWANGQGFSESITSHQPDELDGEILWRFNLAEIPGDCEFSELVGIDRQFMLLDDVKLSLDLGRTQRVRPLETVLFAGEMAPPCRSSGPARALNLLERRGRTWGNLELITLTKPMLFPIGQAACIVVVKIDGSPTWPGAGDLQSGDAVRQDRPFWGPPHTFPLSGIGRVAVVSIGTVDPPER
ncbi:environmental stress-induced protein Ves [Nakamurella sp. UYEF19]|uniref:HutD family protein n=1 Tax=Nakamurella sp. UYEF19 TaxID=1756392 RepID=UPI00339B99E3